MNHDKQARTLTAMTVIMGAILAVLVGIAFKASSPINVELPPITIPENAIGLGGVNNYLDTSSSNITHSTSTINTTSTQVFSGITKIGEIINDTNAQITCSMDATGTTAASSTVASGRGIIIYASSSPAQINSAMFGECYPGAENCYAHKGAVNCLASSAVTITKWSK